MLWPVILPAQITFWILIAAVVTATAVAPAVRIRRVPAFAISLGLAVILFIPSCSGIMTVIDEHRFGVFRYSAFASVGDFRVERYLPPAASDITLEKSPQGFLAKFRIDEDALEKWFESVWDRYGDQSVVTRAEAHRGGFEYVPEEVLDRMNWRIPDDAQVCVGPVAGNGAGFTIWYDASRGTAYQRAAYW